MTDRKRFLNIKVIETKITIDKGIRQVKTRVLVAYASKYGSTQEVAETIAATLCENDLVVDLKPVREVKTLDE